MQEEQNFQLQTGAEASTLGEKIMEQKWRLVKNSSL
jgi:hypothetical protein